MREQKRGAGTRRGQTDRCMQQKGTNAVGYHGVYPINLCSWNHSDSNPPSKGSRLDSSCPYHSRRMLDEGEFNRKQRKNEEKR